VTLEVYRDTVHHSGEKIHAAKAQLEFRLAGTVKNNKKGFLNMLTAKGGSEITLVCCLMRSVTSQIGK